MLTATQVRGLMGTVSSDVLMQAMQTVERNASDELLKLLDGLMTEGQSPLHFAKQLVRFLRNALVSKVAGPESPLLQISSDERQKVANVAALFSEEDLTRFLNIILRTHDELGYRQEQRFHLELGMLKMVHAHRLLPLEELLSQVPAGANPNKRTAAAANSRTPETRPNVASSSGASANRPAPTANPFASPAANRDAAPVAPTRSVASPFEADRARKVRSSEPELSSPASAPDFGRSSLPGASPAIAASATAAAVAMLEEEEPSEVVNEPSASIDTLRSSLIGALESQGQHTAADLLAQGEWKLEASQLTLRLPMSEKVIDLSLSADAKRLLTQEATRVCGRPIKLTLAGGSAAQVVAVARPTNGNGNGNSGTGARQRAAEDPVVKRMQEKFGAEVRTVIDYRQAKK
jgi:DNA polymerase-3 subunit gamma/tau